MQLQQLKATGNEVENITYDNKALNLRENESKTFSQSSFNSSPVESQKMHRI